MRMKKFVQNHKLFSLNYINDIVFEELKALRQSLKEWYNLADFDDLESSLNSFINPVLDTLQFAHSPIDGYHTDETGTSIQKLFADYTFQTPLGLCYALAPDNELDCTDKGCHYAEKIIRLLREHDLNWGILTNGKLWRLYRADDATPYESYLEIHLSSALDDTDDGTFEIFSVFFSPYAFNFVSKAHESLEDTQRLDEMKKESNEAIDDIIEEHIKGNIEEILEKIAMGFVKDEGKERFTEQEREEIFNSSICLLFRIMFILYAEARSLLPIENPKYRAQSLENLIDIAFKAHTEGLDNPQGTSMWETLHKLSTDINLGNPSLNIEPYNGGLFDSAEHPYLSEHKINNAFLSEALFYLAYYEDSKKDKQPEKINYRDLSVRHLGSLYEGVLEYKLFLAEEPMVARPSKNGVRFLTEKEAGTLKKTDVRIPKGGVYFADDPTERKATGSYYTPEYIVDYIVKNTVVTKLQELKSEFDAKREKWLVDLDTAIDDAERERIQRFIDAETLRFVNEKILSLKVLDPAMGSGHFLVNATNAITNFIVELLNDTDWENPEISTAPQLWRRRVVEHCICGVDINPLAVELAKLSLWLISTQKDKPLTFLNHHLKRGNSLIGAKVDALGGLPERKKGKSTKQLSFDFRRNLADGVKQSIAKISELERRQTVDLDDIDKKKELWEDAHQQLEPFRKLANIWVALGYDALHEVKGVNDSLDDDEKELVYSEALNAVSDNSQSFTFPSKAESILESHKDSRFFHWELEFPEVFFELETGEPREDGGFDCVIGNPPYVRQESIKELKPYLEENYEDVYSGYADLAVYFVHRSLDVLKDNGYHSYIITNKWLRANYGTKLRSYLPKVVEIKSLVDLNGTKVFPDAGVDVLIYSFRKNRVENNQFDYCLYGEKTADEINRKLNDKFFKVEQSNLSQNWILESKEIIEVKEHIEKVGTKIKEIDDIEIYRGITTGLNDAFIIDELTRDRLIREDTKSEEIIKPILRGRDIKRWNIEFAGKYLLFIKWDTDIENYPAVERHLENFGDRLEKRPEVKSGRYRWYCLARYGSNFYHKFEKPKIVYAEMSDSPCFVFDDNNFFTNDTCYILPYGTFLALLLNSKLVGFYFKLFSANLGKDANRWKKQYIVEIPIIQIAENEQHVYSKIAEILIELHKEDYPDAEKIEYFDERIADNLVYELYFFDDRQLRDLVASHLDGEIDPIYRGLVSDNAVTERIEEIQNHKYVQVVEDKFKTF